MNKRPRGRPRKFKSRVQTNAEYCRTYRKRLKRSVHFRSDSDLWSTPQETFDKLNAEFGFTVDVCALPENAKCERFYSPEQDGLAQDWSGEIVFCNPPYGRTIAAWVQKAYEASQAGSLVVCLSPGRIGPAWWRTYVQPYADWYVLPKRQNFSGKGPAPFDSVVAIFRPVASVAEADQRLLKRLRWGKWTVEELQWLRTHVESGTTPGVMQAIEAKITAMEKSSGIPTTLSRYPHQTVG